MQVLRAVLDLFNRTGGPVILEDFPDDAPGQGDPENMEGMVCPIPLKKPVHAKHPDLVQAVLDETAALAPWQALFQQSNSRSTLGVSKLSLPQSIQLLGDILASGHSKSVSESDLGAAMRYATEDLRSFYLEAAAMRPGGAASHTQLTEWFWGETSAGALILALHPVCAASGNEQLRRVADTLLIPRSQLHRLQIPA